jgi:hypothetical protein
MTKRISFCLNEPNLDQVTAESLSIEHLAKYLEVSGGSKRDCSKYTCELRKNRAIWTLKEGK